MKNKNSNTLTGVIIVLLGIYLACNALFDWHFTVFFKGWWTLFLIIPSAYSIKREGLKAWSTICLGAGIIFFLSARGIISAGTAFKLCIPAALVIWGIFIITEGSRGRKRIAQGDVLYKNGSPEYSAIFSEQKITCNNEVYVGATINAIFGSADMDLRGAYISEDVAMNCSAIFGGIVIRVPDNVNVYVSCVPIFGGVDNKITNRSIPGAPTLYINATCMFGGIDIK